MEKSKKETKKDIKNKAMIELQRQKAQDEEEDDRLDNKDLVSDSENDDEWQHIIAKWRQVWMKITLKAVMKTAIWRGSHMLTSWNIIENLEKSTNIKEN